MGWTVYATTTATSVSGEAFVQSGTSGGSGIWQDFGGLNSTKTYIVSGVFRAGSGTAFFSVRAGTGTFGTVLGTQSTTATDSVNFRFVFTGQTGVRVYLGASNTGQSGYFDNISVRELPGNHATQPTATARPVLSARYNLLTKTEQFDDVAWVKSTMTVSANAATGPLGAVDADKLIVTNASLNGRVYQAPSTVASPCTFSVYAKAGEWNFIGLYSDGASKGATFNLSNGTFGANIIGAPASYSISDAGGGWWRISVTATPTAGTTQWRLYASKTSNYTDGLGDGTSGVYVWGGQLEPSTSARTYQRVNTATDYDADPAKFKPYLLFDGVDDFLVTNTITPGTDKVQVFAGVRKLSDAVSMLAETGINAGSLGAFYLVTETTNTRYGFASRGARTGIASDQTNVNGFAAPDTAVIHASVDLNAGTPAKIRRNNGAFQNSVSTTFGGGNFLAYPLYIGRRAGTSLPFNGRLYSMVVRFGPNMEAEQITQTETWVNEKTGAY
jgi:hypothetical protein